MAYLFVLFFYEPIIIIATIFASICIFANDLLLPSSSVLSSAIPNVLSYPSVKFLISIIEFFSSRISTLLFFGFQFLDIIFV